MKLIFCDVSFLACKSLIDMVHLVPIWQCGKFIPADRNIFWKSLVKTDIVTDNAAMSLFLCIPWGVILGTEPKLVALAQM